MRYLLAAGVVVGLAACSPDTDKGSSQPTTAATDSSGASKSGAARDSAPGADLQPATADACDPCEVRSTCKGVWREGPFQNSPWTDGLPTNCSTEINHEIPWVYDDCRLSSDAESPEACGAPRAGAQICMGNGFSGVPRWTQSCVTSRDCPAGMVCTDGGRPVERIPDDALTFGHCEKSCTGQGGPAECVRCDLECDVDHQVCRSRLPPVGPSCTADCECYPENGICVAGHCRTDVARPRFGSFCDSNDQRSYNCACRGGECRDFCCYLPDGSVADPGDNICQLE